MEPAPGPARRPFVGRDAEVARLLATLGAIGPSGRLLLIEGEPGIGKTRLAAAVADTVRNRGGVVLEARGYAGEAGIAFSVVAELLRAGLAHPGAAGRLEAVDAQAREEAARLVPVPGIRPPAAAADGDPFARVRLFGALADVLAALVTGPTPGIAWIDDLHHADASSLEFVGYLARRLTGHPLGILVTWRPEDLEPRDREAVLGVATVDELAVTVSLGRFDRPRVAALAAALLGEATTDERVDALLDESEGLPLYVVEALAGHRTQDGTAPGGGVAALLRSRIGAVSDVERQVLGAAAVIGRSFDPALVRLASGRTEDETVEALEELARRGFVREFETASTDRLRLDFTHARLREVTYEGLSLARRRLLHARVAAALGSIPAGAGDDLTRWPLIAYHEALAGRTEAAAEAHRRAGDAARAVFANEEARGHLEAALALGHPATAELHAALGEVLTLLGDYEGALAHLESASALAGADGDPVLEHRQGLIHARRGDWERADRHLIAALTAIDDPATRSRVLADRSAIADRSGDPVAAETLAAEALKLAQAAQDPVGMARALDLLGILARRRGDLPDARLHLERAMVLLDTAEASVGSSQPADPGVRIAALNTLGLVLAGLDDHDRAIALIRDALARCEGQGDRHRQAALENNLADLLHATGHPSEAMEHLRRAVALFAEIGGRPGELEPEIWKLVEW